MNPTRSLDIGLVQISESRYAHRYLPYTIGLLQAYALRHAQNREQLTFRLPVFERVSVAEAANGLEGVDVAAFSVYCWNERRSLAVAAALKAKCPETLILFGGPQIPHVEPDETEAFLRRHPQVDVLVCGEGERAFVALLEAEGNMRSRAAWPGISNLAWLDEQGQFQSTPQAERITDLDSIPSPYLTGVFAPLMKAFPEHRWVATWETNRGCPFQCSFCDWGGLIQTRVYQFALDRVLAEIEWFGQTGVADIFCADANFGMLARDLEIAQHMAICKQRYGAPHLFQTQMAKNVKLRNLEIQRLLADSGLNPVPAISLQSLHPETLKAIRRQNISTERFQEVQQYCQRNGIFSYSDLILGLPGESYDSFADGVSEVIRLGQHNRIMFFNAALLPNAEMATASYRQAHGIQSVAVPFPAQVNCDEISETLEIIIATATLPPDDWVRMQVFAWMSNFLYFLHKPFQILFMILHQQLNLSYRELIELFCRSEGLERYPLLQQVLNSFERGALQIRQGPGDNPWSYSPDEGLQLTPELLAQSRLCETGRWPELFRQAGHLLLRYCLSRAPRLDLQLFEDALKLSEAHFQQLYYGSRGEPLSARRLMLQYNLWDFYSARLHGTELELRREACFYEYSAPDPATKTLPVRA